MSDNRHRVHKWVKAIHEAFDGREVDPQSDGPERIRRLVAERERDRRQIAQLTEALAAAPDVGNLRWLAAVLDVIDDKGLWPDTMPYVLNGKTVELAVDGSGDAVQRELRAFADALAVVRAVLADKEDAE